MSNYDITFADVLLNPPIFYIIFERTIQGKLKAEKNFQHLKYELRFG